MTVTSHNLDLKTGPWWLRRRRREGVTDDFLSDERRGCHHQQQIFWSDDLSDQVEARRACASCPCFRDCTAWALYADECSPDFWIVAGMDPTTRLRIREGREPWRDWRRDFNFAERAARAATRKRRRAGTNKRSQRLAETPPCPECWSTEVYRDGRDREENRQKYTCESCGTSFLGEEL